MNKEDYVSLEVAKLLKEKRFNEYCGAYYHLNWEDMTEEECFEVAPNHDFRNKDNGYRVGAPTLYEAQKWLRETHLIHIDVGMCGDYSTDADGNKAAEWEFWTFDMYYTTNFTNHIYNCKGEYNTYEEALNAGILEALKLI